MPGSDHHPRHILTFDIEEPVHASRFDSPMRRRGWSSYQSRVRPNVEGLLEILASQSTKATFFALGWLAEHHPSLIRRVSEAGHEIACLGYGHELVAAQTPHSFRLDIRQAKRILENVTGRPVVGFRAPNLSITTHAPWALPIVAEEGFLYDSSLLPIVDDTAGGSDTREWIHSRAWNGHRLWEIPPSTLSVGGFHIAIGGGGCIRTFSYPLTKSFLSRIDVLNRPIVISMRSWEIDAAQPRTRGTLLSEFHRHLNLDKTAGQLQRLLEDFQFGPVCEVSLPIREQVASASGRVLSDPVTRDPHTRSPLLTTTA